MTPMRVAILGGGACGTTAAWALARAGVEVCVLEREPRVGGCAAPRSATAFASTSAATASLSRSRALESLVSDLVGADLLLRTRSSAVLHGGRQYRYPLELDDVLRNAGLVGGARALGSYGRQRLRRRRRRRQLRRLGGAALRAAALRHLLRALHAQAVGHRADRDLGRLGGAAHFPAVAGRRGAAAGGLKRGGARTYARRYLVSAARHRQNLRAHGCRRRGARRDFRLGARGHGRRAC